MQVLGRQGTPPAECTPEIMREIMKQHLDAPSMWAIFPLQVWLLSFSDSPPRMTSLAVCPRFYFLFLSQEVAMLEVEEVPTLKLHVRGRTPM